MSSTFNLSTKGRLTIGLTVSVLAAFAISTAQFVAATATSTAAFDSAHVQLLQYKTWGFPSPKVIICALIWPFTLAWFSLIRIRTVRDMMPVRNAFVQNPT